MTDHPAVARVSVPAPDDSAGARPYLAVHDPITNRRRCSGRQDTGPDEGVLLKDAPLDELIRAIRTIAAGDAQLSPAVTKRLLNQVARRLPSAVPRDTSLLAALTEREHEVLRLLAAGMTNAEIATALVISEPTVKTHVSSVLQKLGLRDRVQAVIYAYENGLITAGSGSATRRL